MTIIEISTYSGFTGVALILTAYCLNLSGRISSQSRTYILLNLIGSGIACYSSVIINYWPFVLLEGVWCIASAWAFLQSFRKSD